MEWTDKDFGDPSGAEARFNALLDHADSDRKRSGKKMGYEIKTQIARSQGLQKKFDEARITLNEAKTLLESFEAAAWASAGDDGLDSDSLIDLHRVRTRYLLELGRVCNTSGDKEQANRHFRTAVQVSRLARPSDALDDYEVDALHMIAIVDPSPEERLRKTEAALQIASKSSNVSTQRWQGPLYNNMGWNHFDDHRYEEALECFRAGLEYRVQARSKANGKPERESMDKGIHIAKWTVARTLRALEKFDEALEVLLDLEKGDRGKQDFYVLEELALIYAAKVTVDGGDGLVKAKEFAKKAIEVAEKAGSADGSHKEAVNSLKDILDR
ncbi:hypothetical protein HDU76_013436 [Blyttiomyces sp. JEL0837]|nr:hypothetical protein HDU76_013436 [Blyttiomyces sp. JEL0837]